MKPLSRRIVEENPIDPCAALMFNVDRLDASNKDAQRRASELEAEYDELYAVCSSLARIVIATYREDAPVSQRTVANALLRYERIGQ